MGVLKVYVDGEWQDLTVGAPGPTGPKGDKGDPGSPGVGTGGTGVPAGGLTSQVLSKSSSIDYNAIWRDTHEVPAGGSAGQILAKASGTDYALGWTSNYDIPTGGAAGYVLAKASATDRDVAWQNKNAGRGAYRVAMSHVVWATATTTAVTSPGGVTGAFFTRDVQVGDRLMITCCARISVSNVTTAQEGRVRLWVDGAQAFNNAARLLVPNQASYYMATVYQQWLYVPTTNRNSTFQLVCDRDGSAGIIEINSGDTNIGYVHYVQD